jgi:superfamily I DNA/RNA helicase
MLAAAGIATSPITSARSVESSLTVERPAGTLPSRVAELLAREPAAELGQRAVITADAEQLNQRLTDLAAPADSVAVLTPAQAKGLEFDMVVLVEPAEIVGASGNGISDLYVAMTRATQRLHILHHRPLPAGLPEPR